MSDSAIPPGTLALGEFHPSAPDALKYIEGLGPLRHMVLQEAFSSCALSDNRLAEICSETLRRVMHAEPVSDRYVLGLAWYIRNMEEKDPG